MAELVSIFIRPLMAGSIHYLFAPFHNDYNALQNEFALLLHEYGYILSKSN